MSWWTVSTLTFQIIICESRVSSDRARELCRILSTLWAEVAGSTRNTWLCQCICAFVACVLLGARKTLAGISNQCTVRISTSWARKFIRESCPQRAVITWLTINADLISCQTIVGARLCGSAFCALTRSSITFIGSWLARNWHCVSVFNNISYSTFDDSINRTARLHANETSWTCSALPNILQ